MYTLIVIVHVLACLALIVVVLLQKGKGADLGAAFGGSSQTVFGSQGAGGFFTKLVGVAVGIFMLTSLSLAYMSSHRVQATVMEEAGKAGETASKEDAPEAGTADTAPAGAPGTEQAPPVDAQEVPAADVQNAPAAEAKQAPAAAAPGQPTPATQDTGTAPTGGGS